MGIFLYRPDRLRGKLFVEAEQAVAFNAEPQQVGVRAVFDDVPRRILHKRIEVTGENYTLVPVEKVEVSIIIFLLLPGGAHTLGAFAVAASFRCTVSHGACQILTHS